MAEDAVLERAEGVLDDGAPEPHQGRRGPLVHALQGIVVQMARDHAACALGALGLPRTGGAVGGLSTVVHRAVLARDLHALQRLALPTDEAVVVLVLTEGAAVQQAAGVDRALRRHMRDHSRLLAARGLLAVR